MTIRSRAPRFPPPASPPTQLRLLGRDGEVLPRHQWPPVLDMVEALGKVEARATRRAGAGSPEPSTAVAWSVTREGQMAQRMRPDIADVLAGIGRHWGWVLLFGIVTVLAGVTVLVWPGRTIVVVAVLFGIQLVVAGFFRFVSAFAIEDVTGGTRVLLALLGVMETALSFQIRSLGRAAAGVAPVT